METKDERKAIGSLRNLLRGRLPYRKVRVAEIVYPTYNYPAKILKIRKLHFFEEVCARDFESHKITVLYQGKIFSFYIDLRYFRTKESALIYIAREIPSAFDERNKKSLEEDLKGEWVTAQKRDWLGT